MSDMNDDYKETEIGEEAAEETGDVDTTGGGYTLEVALMSPRFAALEAAIEANPDAAANYLLRGELLMERGWPSQAIGDFKRAVELLEKHLEVDDWDSVAYELLRRAGSRCLDAIEMAWKQLPPSRGE